MSAAAHLYRALSLVGLAVIAAGPARGQTDLPSGGFSLPIRCVPGEDCWIIKYADVDPGPGIQDFTCGPRSDQGHKGTDFAIRDLAAMHHGVAVVAVAPGRVLRRRDGMADRLWSPADPALAGRDCGNGVVVDNGGGWESQYCHLRQGSVAVVPGETVARGATIGLVGLSGRTEFPHVHLSLRHLRKVVDPFTGRGVGQGCGQGGTPLWRGAHAPAYDPGTLYAAGFATGRVTARMVREKAGSPVTLPVTAPALVLWGAAFGVRAGDRLVLSITGPDGVAIVNRTTELRRDRAWHIAYAGRKRRSARWPAGNYRGIVSHRRGRVLLRRRRVEVRLR